MSRWDRICCAVDASEPSRAALQHAIQLAKETGGTLHVLHVVLAPRAVQAAAFAPPPAPSRDAAATPRELAGWIATAREQLPGVVVAVERDSDVAAAIVAYAREWDFDVLVLGTRGRHGIARLVLGSVAESVVRAAPCPVLIVPASGDTRRRDERPSGRHLADADPTEPALG